MKIEDESRNQLREVTLPLSATDVDGLITALDYCEDADPDQHATSISDADGRKLTLRITPQEPQP